MLKYFISSCFGLVFFLGQAQSKPIDLQPKDTVVYKQPYGLRAGIDLSRPVLSFLNDDYTGLEIVGDYRISQRLYVAAELGNEKKTQEEELTNASNDLQGILYNYTTSGSYIKLGVDYNTYENWYGMNNSIHIGGRYAFSSFSQTLNSFNFFDSNRFFSPDDFVPGSSEAQEFDGLNASWLEIVFGMKAELFANIYLGASVRLGFLITNTEDENFPNLWIPGFNKVTDDSNFGVGYNYSITYFLPLYKKAKKPKKEEENQE
ncbi:DUF6048 family protein [Spongiimicrobium sp. 3-5]|uniref:DUF6048 family protein n=1 Tax=Spongiimicrobium sp. 3-5 TaxID=3332596 RepID=UPI003980CE20